MRLSNELPSEPNRAEWDEATRRRSPYAIVVWDDYEVREGLLRLTEEGSKRVARQYFPIATPAVLGEFARIRVGDEAALRTFASRWGLLGYEVLASEHSRFDVMIGGDPVAWIWAHLAGIQTALELHRLRRRKDAEGIERFIHRLSVPRKMFVSYFTIDEALAARNFELAQWLIEPYVSPPSEKGTDPVGVFVIAGKGPNIVPVRHVAGDDPWSASWSILRSILNPNIRGVYPELNQWVERDPESPLVVQGFDALLSVIYRHLFKIVVGGNVEECRECGTLFKQTDGRQRFCPPPDWTRESACAMRFHKREQRRRAADNRKGELR